MDKPLSLSFFLSKAFLTSRKALWVLFWVNLLGTIYGYQWYWKQIQETVQLKPFWQVIYVPDSPTASMFFTLVLVYLLFDLKRNRKDPILNNKLFLRIRQVIEAIAVVSSFKYGIWAVGIIAASGFKGDSIDWRDWMLAISHAGMAVEALIFVRFMRLSFTGLLFAALWVLSNDYIDYHFQIYPWLSDSLQPFITTIRNATILLSLLACFIFYSFYLKIQKNRV